MPKSFDDYLKEGGFSQKDKEALKEQVKEAEDISQEKSPIDTERGFTPDPRDAGKQKPEDREKTVKEAGETLKENDVKPENNPMQKYQNESPFTPNKDLLERNGIDMEHDRDDC